MIVYNARQYETSRGINRFIDCHLGTRPSLCYCYDILTVDDNGTVERSPLIDNGTTLNQLSHQLSECWLKEWRAVAVTAALVLPLAEAVHQHREDRSDELGFLLLPDNTPSHRDRS